MYENIDDNGRIVKCRKHHVCEWCGKRIWIGQEAVKRVYKFDGGFNNARMHPECYIAMQGSYIENSLTDEFEFGCQQRGKTIGETEDSHLVVEPQCYPSCQVDATKVRKSNKLKEDRTLTIVLIFLCCALGLFLFSIIGLVNELIKLL